MRIIYCNYRVKSRELCQSDSMTEDIARDALMFPVSTRAIQKQFALVCEYLGYEGISTHSFRKWYAIEIYKNNGYI